MGVMCFLLGVVAAGQLPFLRAADDSKVKPPVWLHGMNCKVRNATEFDFNDKTKKIGIECYKDENTGKLIYVSETGSIAVVPER
jgi:hypothetical protein